MMSGIPSFLGACRLALGSVSSLSSNNVSAKLLRHISSRGLNKREFDSFRLPSVLNFSTQTEDKKSQMEEGKSEEPQKGGNQQLDELNKNLEDISRQRDELNDKYKRALAESENMRRRLMKQIDEAKIYGIQSFCKDLLEVSDVLAKATECVPKEEVRDSNPHLKNLYEGLTMTEAQLQKVFKRHGLTPVNPIDEKFDPNLHEALFQQEVEGKTPGTVVVVSKIGYKLHERVVRPALVGVAKG